MVMPVDNQLDSLGAVRIRPIVVKKIGGDVSSEDDPRGRRKSERHENQNCRTRLKYEAHGREYSGSKMPSPQVMPEECFCAQLSGQPLPGA